MVFLAFRPQPPEPLLRFFLNALDHHHQVHLFKCLRITLFFLVHPTFRVIVVN